MAKTGSKEHASGEDQGLGSEEEFKHNPHTSMDLQEENEATEVKNKFLRKFTFKDDKKVLRALIKHGFKSGSRRFYRKASLKLSFPANEDQVYEKVRGLKKAYLARLATDSVQGLSMEKIKIHELSHKIWRLEEDEKQKEKEKEEDDVDNKLEEKRAEEFKQKVDNFHRLISMYKEDDLNSECHVLEAVQTAPIPLLERAGLVRSWKELQLQQSQLLQKKRDLISRITQAVETSPLG